MSTSCWIAMEHRGLRLRFLFIECQKDGHPRHTGLFLLQHYTRPEKVEELIRLGDIYWLDKTPAESIPDRYGPGVPGSRETEEELLADWLDSGHDWLFLFSRGQWRAWCAHGLEMVLKPEAVDGDTGETISYRVKLTRDDL